MTLRELIIKVTEGNGLSAFLLAIHKHDKKNTSKLTLRVVSNAYSNVIDELLSSPPTVPLRNRVFFVHSPERGVWLPSVSLLNTAFVEPPKGTKPWGGKNPPKGHYNINLDKHNKYFALGLTSWSQLIDTPVTQEENALDLRYKDYMLLAAFALAGGRMQSVGRKQRGNFSQNQNLNPEPTLSRVAEQPKGQSNYE